MLVGPTLPAIPSPGFAGAASAPSLPRQPGAWPATCARGPPCLAHPSPPPARFVPPSVLQVVTQYGDHEVPHVLEACERMEAHLTAAGKRSEPWQQPTDGCSCPAVLAGPACVIRALPVACWWPPVLGHPSPPKCPAAPLPSMHRQHLCPGRHCRLSNASSAPAAHHPAACSCVERHPLRAAHPGQHRQWHHVCRHPRTHHRCCEAAFVTGCTRCLLVYLGTP